MGAAHSRALLDLRSRRPMPLTPAELETIRINVAPYLK
jgi:hypothetical protein